jgi:hypothetical protein
MTSTYSDRYKLELQETGANANTWGNNTNTNLETIDAFTAGYLSKDVAGSANVTLSTNNADPNAEASNKVIEFTGALTGDITVFVPAVESNYIFFNNTSGSQSLTVAPTGHGSNGVTVVQGAHTIMYNKGDAMVDLFANSLGTFSVKESLTVNGTVISSNGTVNATTYSGNGANLTGVSSIPSGSTALFYQGTAPTGWTQNTAATINDCCLRVVTGSGGGVGGADGFTTTLASSKTTEAKTVPFAVSSSGTVSGSTGDTSLGSPTIASHTHPSSASGAVPRGTFTNYRYQTPANNYYVPFYDNQPARNSGGTGGSGAHSHPFSGSPITASGSVSSDSVSLTVPTMDVKYEDIIAATKD